MEGGAAVPSGRAHFLIGPIIIKLLKNTSEEIQFGGKSAWKGMESYLQSAPGMQKVELSIEEIRG